LCLRDKKIKIKEMEGKMGEWKLNKEEFERLKKNDFLSPPTRWVGEIFW